MNGLVRAHRGRSDADGGFTMVEVLIAMVIVAVVMTALIGVLLSTLTTVVQARQRQTATGLATQALERLRALPYDDITLDDGSTPEPGLAHITGSGPYDFEPTTVLPGVDERLVVNTYSGRWEDIPVDEVTYRVSTYVTRPVVAAGTPQTYNLSALVTWTSSAYPGTRTAAQRSTTYSPAGCLSTAQSPFAAPCQAHFTGNAGSILGGISVTDAVDSNAPVPGFASGTSLEYNLADLSSTVLVEQTASAAASAQTSSASGPAGTSGGASQNVAVDSDPSSVVGQSANVSISGHTSGAQSLTGVAGTLSIRPASGGSGGAAAAIEAPGSICTGPAGALSTGSPDERPCAAASVLSSGTASKLAWVPPAAFGFGGVDVPIVEVGNTGTPWRSVAAQLTAPNIGACTVGAGPTAAGCTHAAAARSLGAVRVGPPATGAATVPSGWLDTKGLWSLDGLAETARAEDGTGAQTPLYTRTGMLSVWNGSGYTPYDLSAGTALSLPIPAVTLTYTGSAGTSYYVTLEGSVEVQPWQVERTPVVRVGDATDYCKDVACVTRVSGGSGVVGDMTVTITTVPYVAPADPADLPAGMVGRFTVGTNLGGLLAQATYKAAPNA